MVRITNAAHKAARQNGTKTRTWLLGLPLTSPSQGLTLRPTPTRLHHPYSSAAALSYLQKLP
jgi:hypothetical protein